MNETHLPNPSPPRSASFLAQTAKIIQVGYNSKRYEEQTVTELGFPVNDESIITWFDVLGVHQRDILKQMNMLFEVHPLMLESILDHSERPRIEDYDQYLMVVVKTVFYDASYEKLRPEQVCLVLGNDMVFSFQERGSLQFQSVRDRLKAKIGRGRNKGADYLLYLLMDVIVDQYIHILLQLEKRIDQLEEEVLENPSTKILARIYRLKRETMIMHSFVFPLREVIRNFQKGHIDWIDETNLIYFQDLYDHTAQAVDTLLSFQDTLSSLRDTYHSSTAFKMNEVMKFLMVISTVFMPMTFISSIYGMNFRYMPELSAKWGYPMVVVLLLGVLLGALSFFRKKGWL